MTSDNSDQASVNIPVRLKPKKSIASRLGSLFASKPGHINECYIELDDSARVYHPGETLKGTLVLDVAKPLGVTHIVVSLFGYLEVFKNHSRNKTDHRDNVARVASGKGKRWVSEYYGDGFASLFEDEVVLCGQGRLDPKLYHFCFELDFPGHLNLPSSIWFERGTVRYVVSATITKPTTMNPTTTTSRKVDFKESIDVGAMTDPKPRFVTLERVERGNRSRMVRSHPNESGLVSPPSRSSSRGDQSSQTTATRKNTSGSRAPTPTSPSIASSMSVSASHTRVATAPADTRSSRTSQSHRVDPVGSLSSTRDTNRTITASIQLSRGGCLPGEMLNVAVKINHTKLVRSVRGVIVTLYRMARVDMHPHLPIGPSNGSFGKAQKFEDYYPRSKTGLGGLSLSAAGSGQVWRKDLCQSFAPIFINPATMSAVVKAAVRVPDDSFPTFRNAPGDMISFRYFVEVVIDIHGKLAGQPGLSEDIDVPNAQIQGSGLDEGLMFDASHQVPRWSTNCIDTAPMRRDKNAIVSVNDLIVGTKDSFRSQGKLPRTTPSEAIDARDGGELSAFHSLRSSGFDQRAHARLSHADRNLGDYTGRNGSHPEVYHDESHYGYDYGYEYTSDPGYWPDAGHDMTDADRRWHDSTLTNGGHVYGSYSEPPSLLPPPAEEGLSEKEQLRRREEALMPSAPPGMRGIDDEAENVSSAPFIPDENHFESADAFRDAVLFRPHNGVAPAQPSSPQAVVQGPISPSRGDFLHDVPSQPVPLYTPSLQEQSVLTLRSSPVQAGSVGPSHGASESGAGAGFGTFPRLQDTKPDRRSKTCRDGKTSSSGLTKDPAEAVTSILPLSSSGQPADPELEHKRDDE